MRITRAAKVAAFPLIVLALVALVACQGGPGTKGDKGDMGDMGDMGDPGIPGIPGESGVDALVAIDTGKVAVIYVNNVTEGVNAGNVGPIPSVSAADYFVGGHGDVTYSLSGPVPASTFKVTKGEDGHSLIIVLRNANAPNPDSPDGNYDDYLVDPTPDDETDGTTPMDTSSTAFTITAKDARGVTAKKAVTVVRNAPPTVATERTDWNAGPIGTQAAKVNDSFLGASEKTDLTMRCKTTFNVCTENVVVEDVESTAPEDHFRDHQEAELMITVEGVPAGGISVTPKGQTLEITGMTSTWNLKGGPAGDTPTDEPYMFYVVATDKQGLSAKREISVSVDAAPTVSIQISNRTLKQSDAATVLVSEATKHFTDDKRQVMEIDDMDGVVTVPADSTVADVSFADDAITVTSKNPGTVMIKVTASESDSDAGLGQFVSQTFMVTVTAD